MKARLAIPLALLVLVPSGSFAWRFRSMPQLASYHDDSVYWLSAKSLAQGEGYRIPHLPEEPAQTKYPPLYPALLSLVWKFGGAFPGNLSVVTALQWSFVPIAAALAWLYFRRIRFEPLIAYWMTLAIAAGPMTVIFSVSSMTELPFTTVLLGVMLLIETEDELPVKRAFFAGVLAGAAFLIRSNAIVLAATVPMLWILRRRYRPAAAFALPLLATIAGWQSWCALHAFPAKDNILFYYTSYVGFYVRTFSLADLPTRVWVNVDAVIEALARLVIFNTGEQLWMRPLAWVITATAVAGAVMLYRRGIRQYPAFAVLFVAMLLLWQYPPDQRFVYPILPLYIAGLVTKLTEIGRLAVNTWRTVRGANRFAAVLVFSMIFAVIAGCAASMGYGIFVLLPSYFHDRQEQRAHMRPVYLWIALNTRSDERFAAYDDTLLYLYTRRQGYTVPILPALVYGTEADAVSKYVFSLADLWREKGVTYVLATEYDFQRDLHKPAQDSLSRLLQDRSRFQQVYGDPTARVYRLAPEPGTLQSQ